MFVLNIRNNFNLTNRFLLHNLHWVHESIPPSFLLAGCNASKLSPYDLILSELIELLHFMRLLRIPLKELYSSDKATEILRSAMKNFLGLAKKSLKSI